MKYSKHNKDNFEPEVEIVDDQPEVGESNYSYNYSSLLYDEDDFFDSSIPCKGWDNLY